MECDVPETIVILPGVQNRKRRRYLQTARDDNDPDINVLRDHQ